MLEIGAADRRMERRLKEKSPPVVYKSMDIDRRLRHDFYSLEEIQEQFDVVLMFEIIEHLPLEEGASLLTSVVALLTPGGLLLLSTPNVYHPNTKYWDMTHRSFYSYDQLAALVSWAGLRVEEIYRCITPRSRNGCSIAILDCPCINSSPWILQRRS